MAHVKQVAHLTKQKNEVGQSLSQGTLSSAWCPWAAASPGKSGQPCEVLNQSTGSPPSCCASHLSQEYQ